jgi:hypothetical protein
MESKIDISRADGSKNHLLPVLLSRQVVAPRCEDVITRQQEDPNLVLSGSLSFDPEASAISLSVS